MKKRNERSSSEVKTEKVVPINDAPVDGPNIYVLVTLQDTGCVELYKKLLLSGLSINCCLSVTAEPAPPSPIPIEACESTDSADDAKPVAVEPKATPDEDAGPTIALTHPVFASLISIERRATEESVFGQTQCETLLLPAPPADIKPSEGQNEHSEFGIVMKKIYDSLALKAKHLEVEEKTDFVKVSSTFEPGATDMTIYNQALLNVAARECTVADIVAAILDNIEAAPAPATASPSDEATSPEPPAAIAAEATEEDVQLAETAGPSQEEMLNAFMDRLSLDIFRRNLPTHSTEVVIRPPKTVKTLYRGVETPASPQGHAQYTDMIITNSVLSRIFAPHVWNGAENTSQSIEAHEQVYFCPAGNKGVTSRGHLLMGLEQLANESIVSDAKEGAWDFSDCIYWDQLPRNSLAHELYEASLCLNTFVYSYLPVEDAMLVVAASPIGTKATTSREKSTVTSVQRLHTRLSLLNFVDLLCTDPGFYEDLPPVGIDLGNTPVEVTTLETQLFGAGGTYMKVGAITADMYPKWQHKSIQVIDGQTTISMPGTTSTSSDSDAEVTSSGIGGSGTAKQQPRPSAANPCRVSVSTRATDISFCISQPQTAHADDVPTAEEETSPPFSSSAPARVARITVNNGETELSVWNDGSVYQRVTVGHSTQPCWQRVLTDGTVIRTTTTGEATSIYGPDGSVATAMPVEQGEDDVVWQMHDLRGIIFTRPAPSMDDGEDVEGTPVDEAGATATGKKLRVLHVTDPTTGQEMTSCETSILQVKDDTKSIVEFVDLTRITTTTSTGSDGEPLVTSRTIESVNFPTVTLTEDGVTFSLVNDCSVTVKNQSGAEPSIRATIGAAEIVLATDHVKYTREGAGVYNLDTHKGSCVAHDNLGAVIARASIEGTFETFPSKDQSRGMAPPRLFVVYRNGNGVELMSRERVEPYISKHEGNPKCTIVTERLDESCSAKTVMLPIKCPKVAYMETTIVPRALQTNAHLLNKEFLAREQDKNDTIETREFLVTAPLSGEMRTALCAEIELYKQHQSLEVGRWRVARPSPLITEKDARDAREVAERLEQEHKQRLLERRSGILETKLRLQRMNDNKVNDHRARVQMVGTTQNADAPKEQPARNKSYDLTFLTSPELEQHKHNIMPCYFHSKEGEAHTDSTTPKPRHAEELKGAGPGTLCQRDLSPEEEEAEADAIVGAEAAAPGSPAVRVPEVTPAPDATENVVLNPHDIVPPIGGEAKPSEGGEDETTTGMHHGATARDLLGESEVKDVETTSVRHKRKNVKLPKAILGVKPNVERNHKTIELESERRRGQKYTTSRSALFQAGFTFLPGRIDMGDLIEGETYAFRFTMTNAGTDSCRFKIRQPPASTGAMVVFKPGPVAAGLRADLTLVMLATRNIHDGTGPTALDLTIDVVTETEKFKLPVTATIHASIYKNDKIKPAKGVTLYNPPPGRRHPPALVR